MGKILFVLLTALGFSGLLYASEPSRETEPSRELVQEFIIDARNMDQYLLLIGQQKATESNKEMLSAEAFLESYLNLIQSEVWTNRLKEIYTSRFSDQEIQQLLACKRLAVCKKETALGGEIGMELMQIIGEIVNAVIENCPEAPEAPALTKISVDVTDENYEQELLSTDVPVVVKAYTQWCPPCKAMTPVFESLAQNYQLRAKFVCLDIDQAKVTAKKFKISRVPTFLIFKNGCIVDRSTGFLSAESLKSFVDKNLDD